MRSITTKLLLAFLVIGVIVVIFVASIARWNTRTEFIRYLSDQNQTDLLVELSEYYQENGSWNGIEDAFKTKPHGGFNSGAEHAPPPSFILADENGYVLTQSKQYGVGEALSSTDRQQSTPIIEEDQIIGYYLPIQKNYGAEPRELEFIERVNRALLFGGLIGAIVSLLLGAFLSRTLTRPIRKLIQATQAVSKGHLLQQVDIKSNDELGELAQSFNHMSAELSRSVNARKQMTADVAHELRTPLSLILGHAEAVHDGVLPPTLENFEIIRDEAIRLEHLVNDLRILSLADAGELTMNKQPVEPEQLFQDAITRHQLTAQQKNIQLHLDITPPLSTLELDPLRMTQVLTNIIDNAIRHTPLNGIITLSTHQTDTHLQITITDNGPGLSAQEAERIFERFYRADASRQRDGGGSGLGLAIAKSIVQGHKGQVWAESEAGKGLRVHIQLPR